MLEDAALLNDRPGWTASVARAGPGGRGAALLLWIAPLVLDTFAVNVLTRSMIYAVLAVTVDLLWGFAGILTFGQAAFFGVGAYATAMTLAASGRPRPGLRRRSRPPRGCRRSSASRSAGCPSIIARRRSTPR